MECFPMPNPSCDYSSGTLPDLFSSVLVIIDNQGTISSISDGCNEILGYFPEEMVGRPVSAFVDPEEKARAGEAFGLVQQGKKHLSCFPVVGKDGSFHQALIISRCSFDNQVSTGMICLIGEISAGKQPYDIIRNANTRIHLLNSLVRHDINNQLTLLNGYLSLMEQDGTTIQSPQIIRILLDATEKIQKMVTFTTEFKDLGTHLPAWTNLYKVFQSARSSFECAGVEILADPVCQDLELFTDPALTKVFHHLIDNSLRHGMTVSLITLNWRLEGERAIIVYEDNGTGISKTLRPALFQPGKMKKTGYGLFLVHEILAIHGFTITETGISEKGVRFEIAVPHGSFRTGEKKQQQP
jgi:PAS domain S-box-containing protein